MLGSQALETAIGLSLFLGALSVAASALTESYARAVGQRARDLQATLDELLTTVFGAEPAGGIQATQAYRSEVSGLRRRRLTRDAPSPSYLDRETVVDAVLEIDADPAQPSLPTSPARSADDVRDRVRTAVDAALAQARDAYKRWATVVLFLVATGLCVAGNLSVVTLADRLWNDDLARAALIEDLQNGEDPPPVRLAGNPACGEKAARSRTDSVRTDLPVGWGCDPRETVTHQSVGQNLLMVLGWLLTAFLAMVGGQTWFDVAGRLVRLRPGSAPADMATGAR